MDDAEGSTTPSRLRPPQARLSAIPYMAGAVRPAENAGNAGAAPEGAEVPPAKRTLPAPAGRPATTSDGSRVVKTYRSLPSAAAPPVSAADARRQTAEARASAASAPRPALNIQTSAAARLEGMERIIAEMNARFAATEAAAQQSRADSAALAASEAEREALAARVAAKDRAIGELEEELRNTRRRLDAANFEWEERMSAALRASREEGSRLREEYEGHASALRAEAKRWEEEVLRERAAAGRLSAELAAAQSEADGLRAALSRASAASADVQAALAALSAERDAARSEVGGLRDTIATLHGAIAAEKQTSQLLASRLQAADATRKRLHNMVMELRGNIRVVCRVRPLLGHEAGAGDELPVRVPHAGGACDGGAEELRVLQPAESATGGAPGVREHVFAFDRVFAPGAGQDAVFEEISALVQSALDGYRVCIFAYGQTGSGKTYTMEGGAGDARGMIPRAVSLIFAHADEMRGRGWAVDLEASFLEIYNEAIRDLLAEGRPDARYDVRHAPDGRTTVSDLTLVSVHDAAAVHALLARASRLRAVAGTLCNERSSRSHSVFSLRISMRGPGGAGAEGVLNLVDLAGSERLAHSGATGDRLRETQAINKSLSALGDVVAALGAGSAHVPYRNSKLTYLLAGALGAASAKTLMFVNVSPAPSSVGETLCSLRFAAKVNAVHLGAAKRLSVKRAD